MLVHEIDVLWVPTTTFTQCQKNKVIRIFSIHT
jgi:hypothetical protein